MVPLNDSEPTYISGDGRLGGVIDLIFVSAALCKHSLSEVTSDCYTSDHFLVLTILDTTPNTLSQSQTNTTYLKLIYPISRH